MLIRQQNDEHYFSPNPSAQQYTTTDPNPGDQGQQDSSDSRDSISDTLNPQQMKQLSNTLKNLERDISYFEDYSSTKKVKMNHRVENSIRVAEQKKESFSISYSIAFQQVNKLMYIKESDRVLNKSQWLQRFTKHRFQYSRIDNDMLWDNSGSEIDQRKETLDRWCNYGLRRDLDNQIPAPRLKDAKLDSKQQFFSAYHQVIIAMRVLYQQCHLVHADLSQYNILYWKSTAYIIDVSQSVQNDHPMSMDFLRRDCANVNSYFAKIGGVQTLTLFGLFKFITKISNHDDNDQAGGYQSYKLMIKQSYKEQQEDTDGLKDSKKFEKDNDQIFKNMYLPCNTSDFDVSKLAKGCLDNQEIINQHIGVYQREYQMPFNPSDLPSENRGRIKLLIKRLMNYSSKKDEDDQNDQDDEQEQLQSGESSNQEGQAVADQPKTTGYTSKYSKSKYFEKNKAHSIQKKEFDTESPRKSQPSSKEDQDQMQSDQFSSNFTGRQTSYDDQIKQESDGSSSSSDDENEISIKFSKQKYDMFQGLSKKQRKQKVKQQKRQKREQKIPKHIKKRAVKKAHIKKK